MGQHDSLHALASWIDAGLVETSWSEPLTLSLRLAGARALALGVREEGAGFELLGWSLGAPADFLNFCRELAQAPAMPGWQECSMAGLGRVCWVTVARRGAPTSLFAIFDRDVETRQLGPVAEIAQTCVAARARVRIARAS